MLNSEPLFHAEKKLAYVLAGMTDHEARELARLGLLMHVIYSESLSPDARHTFDDVLRSIGPEFLLAFRALRQTARHAIRKRRNWRSRA